MVVTKDVIIGNKTLGPERDVFIVAEAGLNHNGSLAVARDLVRRAAEIGADAVKFQSYHTEDFVSKKSDYYQLFKNLELSESDFADLKKLADERNIIFLSTPLDLRYVDVLKALDVPAFKIASGDITFTPLLEAVAKTGKPILLSTGAATIGEIYDAMHALRQHGGDELVLLQCLSAYPAPPEEINLRALVALKEIFDVPTGYSDHSIGIEVPLAAVALGACVIEKHFTLDKKMKGPDHALSAEPSEFERMIEAARVIEKSLGNDMKAPMKSEQYDRLDGRRSVVSRTILRKGDRLNSSNIGYKRPASGIDPHFVNLIMGKRIRAEKGEDDQILWSDLLEE